MSDQDQNSDAQFQYVEGQQRPTFPAMLLDFQSRSDAIANSAPGSLDIAYGPNERERFDFFPARAGAGVASGTLVYFHAGYWQLRDKSLFRLVAPAFTRRGLNVALVNYPLCPSVSVVELLASARRSIPAVLAHAAGLAQPAGPLIAAGHSAGAQIAVEMALSRWSESGDRAQAVDGVVGVSGVYDLVPLVGTTLNEKLRLDTASAKAVSPLRRDLSGTFERAVPALFVVGGTETPAFLEQSTRMHEAWRAAGNESALMIFEGNDHFSVLEPLIAEEGAVPDAIDAMLAQVRRAPGSRWQN